MTPQNRTPENHTPQNHTPQTPTTQTPTPIGSTTGTTERRRRTRWPEITVTVLLVALITLYLGGGLEPRTDLTTTVRSGQTFTTGPFELRFTEVRAAAGGWDPTKSSVIVAGESRLLARETDKLDDDSLRLVLPDGTEVEPEQQRVGDFWTAGTPMQPRMPPRRYEVIFQVPASTLRPGQPLQLAVAELVKRKDPLGQKDSWAPSGRRMLVELGPIPPG